MKRLAAIWSFLLISLSLQTASAEYRVFKLKITTAEGTSTEVLSTLDPEQYPRYYPLKITDKISYTETWMCRGRTSDFKEPCANPRAPASTEPQ